jgi:hypothetical protein
MSAPTLTVQRSESYDQLTYVLRFIGFYGFFYIIHFLLGIGYRIAAGFVMMLNLVLAFITGKSQKGLTDYIERYLRYDARLNLTFMGLVDDIPNVDVSKDDPESGVQASVPADELSKADCILRLTPITMLLLTPHFIILGFYSMAAGFCWFFGLIVVIFTGSWNDAMFNLIVGFYRWKLRVEAYLMGLSTQYPPFSAS